MATSDEISWYDRGKKFINQELRRRHSDEDLRDDDMKISDKVADSKPLTDDKILRGDDLIRKDVDTDHVVSWDEKHVGDLDNTDVEDLDQANKDIHSIKNDTFGSLASTIKNENAPGPDEIPEEHQAGEELDYPDDDKLEQGTEHETEYEEGIGVSPPHETEAPEQPKRSTLGRLDSSFIGLHHPRKTRRMIDHEPGSRNNL